jgi:hypothetical protein
MSKKVYANGNEVSGKANSNKSLCAMPDVCLSPPSPPAGPVPIPYPNTSMASKTSQGSKTVKIGGQEVGLKNKSNYKDSNGDEAATRGLGMGVISHTIQGKMKHAAWSFDVKVEGENAIRHLDLTTHNHINTGNAAVTANAGLMDLGEEPEKNCEELQKDNDAVKSGGNGPPASQVEGRTTLTTGQYTAPNGKRGSGWAFSRQTDKPGAAKGVGPGGDSQLKDCSGFDYQRKNFMPHSSHTEARMIEDIFKAQGPNPGGTLVMRIQWNSRDGMRDDPCPNCQELICSAQECGLDIKLCTDEDVKKKSKGSEPDCP